MEFLIQNNLIHFDKINQIKQAVKNYPCKFVDLIPYILDIPDVVFGDMYIPIGSTLLTLISIKKHFKGLHFNPNTFDYSVASLNRSDMLNDEYIMTIEESLSFLKSKKTKWFVRPNDDLKQFTGTVIDSEECYEWFDDALQCKHGSYKMSSDMKVVFSKPKNLSEEWRWFIVDGNVVSGSLYRYKGKDLFWEETDENMIMIAKLKAKGWIPHPNCVMDMVKIGTDYKIIEFNCINSSGFYNANIKLILQELYNYSKTY